MYIVHQANICSTFDPAREKDWIKKVAELVHNMSDKLISKAELITDSLGCSPALFAPFTRYYWNQGKTCYTQKSSLLCM